MDNLNNQTQSSAKAPNAQSAKPTEGVSGGESDSCCWTEVSRKRTCGLPRQAGAKANPKVGSRAEGKPERQTERATTGPNGVDKATQPPAYESAPGSSGGSFQSGRTGVASRGPRGPPTSDPNTKPRGTQEGPSASAQRRNRRLRKLQALQSSSDAPTKRAREVSDGSLEQAREAKKPKTQGSYRDVVAASLRMAVILEGYPERKMTIKEGHKVQDLMFDRLMAMTGPPPLVNMGNIVSGALFFTCADETSAKWLKELTGSKVGEDKTIRVVAAKDLPKPVKMAWKSRAASEKDNRRVLMLVEKMNPGLKTQEWRVIDTQNDEFTVRRIVMMDKDSAEFIKARDYRLPTGIDFSIFKLLEDASPVASTSGEEQREPPEEGDPPASTAVTEPANPPQRPMTPGAPPSPVSTIGTEDLFGEMRNLALEEDALLEPSPDSEAGGDA
ncbi:uncharacterized protein LOC142979494 [Anticarsia gemmatalis]|uniref:uncharacterized protein LOC142979494 n=1 Tax=Anticarsia gemmatalis TaxID=129554 RepID=UPI003F77161B